MNSEDVKPTLTWLKDVANSICQTLWKLQKLDRLLTDDERKELRILNQLYFSHIYHTTLYMSNEHDQPEEKKH